MAFTSISCTGTISAPAADDPKRSTSFSRGGQPRLLLLSSNQYAKTVATLFEGRSSAANHGRHMPEGLEAPLDEPLPTPRFTTRATANRMDGPRLQGVMTAADAVSEALLNAGFAQPCLQESGPVADCLRAPVKEAAILLFRRPGGEVDIDHILDAVASVAPDVGRRAAARHALKMLLVSPRFLYRSERGSEQEGRLRLDVYEVASAISYSLTDGPPDDALWAAAVSGDLAEGEVIAQHVHRLLDDVGKSEPANQFVRELFGYDKAPSVNKDADFHRPTRLVHEADLYVENLLGQSGQTAVFDALLTSREAFVSPATSASYSLSLEGDSQQPQVVTFQGERQGVLGHPAWLTAYSKSHETDPIRRGLFVFQNLLCGGIAPAPVDDIPEIPEDPERTLREKLALHTENPSCHACHVNMDGIGLGLEAFDHYGRLRETEAGKPVVRTADLPFKKGLVPFEGLDGMVQELASSDQYLECMVANVFEYFRGRPPTEGDASALEAAKGEYLRSGGSFASVVAALFTDESFLYPEAASQ